MYIYIYVIVCSLTDQRYERLVFACFQPELIGLARALWRTDRVIAGLSTVTCVKLARIDERWRRVKIKQIFAAVHNLLRCLVRFHLDCFGL